MQKTAVVLGASGAIGYYLCLELSRQKNISKVLVVSKN